MACPNVKECICPKTTCPNHGKCCACVIKHRGTDRSINGSTRYALACKDCKQNKGEVPGMSCPNVKECACPKKTCPNNGRCCACVIKHRETDSLPYCLFLDNDGDKSVKNYYQKLKMRFENESETAEH